MANDYPKFHLSFFKKEFSSKVIYEDDSLRINANYVLDSNKKISKIELCSIGKDDVYYKIKDVNPCVDDNPLHHNSPFYMIHLYSHDSEEIGNHYTFIADVNNHLRGLKLDAINNSAIFKFNIFTQDVEIETPCLFNDIQPETKDGAIIVSI